ncbi:MAG TPA: hypothetical protein VN969_17190 [Streptosporangiaceae bacterium]|nr:hypothetical protein [Streptosporangiaceae bacterium]
MYVVLILAFIVIVVGVFAVATGRGGELAYEQADHAPLDIGTVSATDIALLRPPTALWGYNMQVTDEALDRIARALRDRDIEIAYLQRQLADVSNPQWADQSRPFTPKHERPEAHGGYTDPETEPAEHTPALEALEAPEPVEASAAPELSEAPEPPEAPETAETLETAETPEPAEAQETAQTALTAGTPDPLAEAEEQAW